LLIGHLRGILFFRRFSNRARHLSSLARLLCRHLWLAPFRTGLQMSRLSFHVAVVCTLYDHRRWVRANGIRLIAIDRRVSDDYWRRSASITACDRVRNSRDRSIPAEFKPLPRRSKVVWRSFGATLADDNILLVWVYDARFAVYYTRRANALKFAVSLFLIGWLTTRVKWSSCRDISAIRIVVSMCSSYLIRD